MTESFGSGSGWGSGLGERIRVLIVDDHQMVRAGLAQQRNAHKEDLLRRLLQSKTFAIAILLSRLRQRGEPAFSKDEVRRLLAE